MEMAKHEPLVGKPNDDYLANAEAAWGYSPVPPEIPRGTRVAETFSFRTNHSSFRVTVWEHRFDYEDPVEIEYDEKVAFSVSYERAVKIGEEWKMSFTVPATELHLLLYALGQAQAWILSQYLQ